MQAILEAYGISVPQLLGFAPWLFVSISLIAFVADILFSRRPDTSDDPYEPLPGDKWFFQRNAKLRSNEEPPPNDEMKEEEALFQAKQGQWPSWYIDWDYQNNTWDWGKGWRREGLPPISKREPTAEGQKWYWQQHPDDRRADEPPATEQMVNEELLNRYDQGPWPPWYLTSELRENVEGDPAPANPVWTWGREWKRDGPPNRTIPRNSPPDYPKPTDAFTAYKTVSTFLVVYTLIMMADWIQGPYIYAVYKELKIPEHQITMLYGADSVAAVVTAKFTGLFTDRLGRKLACLVFCVAYILNNCSMVISSCWEVNMAVLIAGRLFRGIATNLLYSAFESWFIAAYDSLKLRKLGFNIGRIFGYLTVIKGSSAFLAGILSEEIVQFTGYKTYNMVASGTLFAIAWLVIAFSWEENYGLPMSSAGPTDAVSRPDLGALNAVSIVFNISLDIFTLLWARALEDAAPKMVLLRYPLIYNTFLGCTIFGALLSNILVSTKKLLGHNNSLTVAILVGAACLAVPFFAGSNFVLTFAVLCLFRICTGMISPAISQLKYNIVPNTSRAETYTIFHLPFFQWSHWVDYGLVFFFGPHPDDVAEKVFLYLSLLMAAVGLIWYRVSNGHQLFPSKTGTTPGDSDIPPPGGATALSSVKQKFYRILQALNFVFQAIGALLSTVRKALLNAPPFIGALLMVAIFGAIWTITYAINWTIQKPRGLWRWMFYGGKFPKLAVSPPPSPIHPPVPPAFQDIQEGDESNVGNFRRFWNALGDLSRNLVFWVTVLTLLVLALFPLLMILELPFGTDISTYLLRAIPSAGQLAARLLLESSYWAVYLCTGAYLKIAYGLSFLSASALDIFTTCSRKFFTTIDWSIHSFFELYDKIYALSLSFLGIHHDLFNIATKPVRWLIDLLTPEGTVQGEIKNTVQNATVSIGKTVVESATDSKNTIVDIFNSRVERLFFLASRLIPVGWKDSALVDYISQGTKEIYDAGSRILLKDYGWEDILHDNLIVLSVVTLVLAAIGYCMPWQHIGEGIFIISKLCFLLVKFVVVFVAVVAILAGRWVYDHIKRPLYATQAIITAPFTWIYNNADRIYRSLPSPAKVLLDPPKFLFAFLLDLLKKAIGSSLWLIGYLMIEFGQRFGYGVWKVWNSLESLGGIIDRFTIKAWKALGRFGRKICKSWMGIGRWLEKIGEEIWGSDRPAPRSGPAGPPGNGPPGNGPPGNGPPGNGPPGNGPPGNGPPGNVPPGNGPPGDGPPGNNPIGDGRQPTAVTVSTTPSPTDRTAPTAPRLPISPTGPLLVGVHQRGRKTPPPSSPDSSPRGAPLAFGPPPPPDPSASPTGLRGWVSSYL